MEKQKLLKCMKTGGTTHVLDTSFSSIMLRVHARHKPCSLGESGNGWMRTTTTGRQMFHERSVDERYRFALGEKTNIICYEHVVPPVVYLYMPDSIMFFHVVI